MHKIAILPTLLTLGNAVCGFASIAYASRIGMAGSESDKNVLFLLSGGLILVAMIFDMLDGYVARLSKSSSDFGGQLDSLCDAISFGLAPAFLLLCLSPEWGQLVVRQGIAVVAALYLACTVLRLARFNLENTPDPASHKRFKGLPSPAAAGCVATLIILRAGISVWTGIDPVLLLYFVQVWAPLGTLTVALLMVSNLSYPHFTKQLVRRRRHFSMVVQAVLLLALIALTREVALFALFWAYALHAPLRYLISRGVHRDALPAQHARLD